MATGFVTGTASVNNGSKIVTLDGGVDASQVSSGTAIFIGSFPPVEAISGTVGQITLRNNWPNANQTSQPFTTIYTIEGLRDAVQNASDVSANMLAITSSHEALLTSIVSSINITINDVVTPFTPYQFLVDQFEASQVLLDAAIIPLSKSKLDNPLLHILKKNKLTDTIAGSLTWTRSTTATFVDRYGVVKTAAIDVAREEAEGWLIEGASTNLALRSEEFDNATWQKANLGLGSVPVVTANFASSPDETTTAERIELTMGGETGTNISRVFQSITATDGTFSFFAKSNDNSTYTLYIEAGDGLNTIAITPVYQRFTISTTIAPGSVQFGLRSGSHGGTQNSLTADILVWGAQFEELPFASSYIKTVASTVSRDADDTSVLVNGNFVSQAQSDHSLVMTYRLLGDTGSAVSLYSSRSTASSTTVFTALSTTGDGSVVYRDGSSSQSDSPPNTIGSEHIVVLVTEGTTILAYSDGVADDPVSNTPTDTIDLAETLHIGSNDALTSHMFGHFLDIRIYDFALNDLQVKFLSGE